MYLIYQSLVSFIAPKTAHANILIRVNFVLFVFKCVLLIFFLVHVLSLYLSLFYCPSDLESEKYLIVLQLPVYYIWINYSLTLKRHSTSKIRRQKPFIFY